MKSNATLTICILLFLVSITNKSFCQDAVTKTSDIEHKIRQIKIIKTSARIYTFASASCIVGSYAVSGHNSSYTPFQTYLIAAGSFGLVNGIIVQIICNRRIKQLEGSLQNISAIPVFSPTYQGFFLSYNF